ncbi:LLM class flavin-dependent oxidoreductase [Acuticoccus sp. MNP-M23]|uniref:LLM class flavin-dependent oxidoreductase n=1 Tax=Acuticoccus sp. MNP-M23 TaxID=3072793 RepID=UPI0028155640|nr:LLM class flavin-dependent oxidoreductase [Acuticoccus sp. MNP-M23]WMS41085.1 LLM class flavin-dependent oxidoreductase [Acuticoccus sp. MNP-M23]
MIPYSVLDLSPIPEGGTAGDALANSVALARHAEGEGFNRYWLAEHHNMPGIASAATAVVIGQIAAHTSTIRVGSGGIMLPNHAPLMVAEQFGTLATLFPGRIDLGLGRAPGTDMNTARALRRAMDNSDNFPQDVTELLGYLEPADPRARVLAIPGVGTKVPVWILGSSTFGAQLAALLGLPYAFASHFAPASLGEALATYRQNFRPSPWRDTPYFMLAVNVFGGADDAEGRYLMSSMQQAFSNLRTGQPGPLPKPVDDVDAVIDRRMRAAVNEALSVSAVGGPESVRTALGALVNRYEPDEVIITGQIHDPAARQRSFSIAADAMRTLGQARAAA